MNLIKRVIALEQRAKGDAPYAFMVWLESEGQTEQEALQKYEQEYGVPFPDYGLILRIIRACKPNGEEV